MNSCHGEGVRDRYRAGIAATDPAIIIVQSMQASDRTDDGLVVRVLTSKPADP
eukprot:gene19893-biopygen6374